MKTYEEIINANGGKPVEFTVTFGEFDEMTIRASCWTDDPDTMKEEAKFDIRPNWGDSIGRFDNIDGHLNPHLDELLRKVKENVGGHWMFDGDDRIVQTETEFVR